MIQGPKQPVLEFQKKEEQKMQFPGIPGNNCTMQI